MITGNSKVLSIHKSNVTTRPSKLIDPSAVRAVITVILAVEL